METTILIQAERFREPWTEDGQMVWSKKTAGISSFPASASGPALHWSARADSRMSRGTGMQWE